MYSPKCNETAQLRHLVGEGIKSVFIVSVWSGDWCSVDVQDFQSRCDGGKENEEIVIRKTLDLIQLEFFEARPG